jgi:predicted transcriptional regulator
MSKHALLLSIRPKYADMIFAGTKTVELRRVRPTIQAGDLVLVYVSSPTKEMQGAFRVGKTVSGTPSAIWKKFGNQTGVTREEFDTYFTGKDQAHALLIEDAWTLPKPVRLACLRKEKQGFRPPQSFHYIRGAGFPSSFGIPLPN